MTRPEQNFAVAFHPNLSSSLVPCLWRKPESQRGGSWPQLSGVKNPQDRYGVTIFRIDDEIVWPHDHLTLEAHDTPSCETPQGRAPLAHLHQRDV